MTPTDRPRCYRADMTLTPPSAERISRLRSCAERGAPRRPEGGRREATATVPNPAHPLPSDLSRRRVGALVGARKILSPVSVSQSLSRSVGKEPRTKSTFLHACIAASLSPPTRCKRPVSSLKLFARQVERERERERGGGYVCLVLHQQS